MHSRSRNRFFSVFISFLFVASLPSPASAGLLDKIKETTAKTLDVVKDVKDTVTTGKKIEEETRRTRDVLIYNDSVQLNRDQIYQLQFALNNRGYDAGLADGQMGQKTRNAIAAYQRDNGFHADGSLSRQIYSSIVSGTSPTYQANIPLNRSEWRQFQSMLNELGFDAGTPDGKPGPRTRRAVDAFKRSWKLSAAVSERDAYKAASGATGRGPAAQSGSSVASIQQSGAQTQYDNVEVKPEEAPPAARFTGYGAMYRQLMSAWIHSERASLPEEVLAAAYVYAFEGHERQEGYCKSLEGSSNALQASDALSDMQQRYHQFLQQSALIKAPVKITYSFTAKNPYKNYDLDQGELVLRGHQWGKRVNLADGRTGIEYTPCSAVLKTPAVAQIQSNTVVPEEFDLDVGEFVSSLLAAKAKQQGADSIYSSTESFNFLTRVAMDRDQAASLLDQGRTSAALDVSVSVTLERTKPARDNRPVQSPFYAVALKVIATDVNTGIVVHDFEMQSPRNIDLPEYLIPASAPTGSGLPDGLAYLDGAIVTYPEHSAAKLGTTPQTQLALRKLQQKLLLQGAPQLANEVDAALYFADLAEAGADQYLTRKPLIETVESYNARWQNVPGFEQNEPMVTTGWIPTADVFDAERMRRAYVSEIGSRLLEEPIQFPIEFVQLREIGIRTYDIKTKGFPLSITGNSFGAKLPVSAPRLRAAGSHQELDLDRHVRFLAPFKSMPQVWSVPFENAESVQDKLSFSNNFMGRELSDEEFAAMLKKNPSLSGSLSGNQVSKNILATRFRVTGLRYEPPRSGLVGQVRLDTELVDMTVFGDRELTNKIGQLPAPPNAIVATEGVQWAANATKRLEPDVFRLLYLSANTAAGKGQQLTGEFWQSAAIERLELERLVSQNSWSSFKVIKPYWGQFYTQSQLASRQPLAAQEIEKYRQWTLSRSEFVGRRFISSQVFARKASDTEISTDGLGRQLLDRLVNIRSGHGVNSNVEENLKKSSRALALAEAKKQFPGSSEWMGLFNGPDMHVGVALKGNPAWYSQVWTGDVQVTRDTSNPIAVVTVDGVHTFVDSDGKPGVIVSFDIDTLEYYPDSGKVIQFSPVGGLKDAENSSTTSVQAEASEATTTESTGLSALSILDVTLGEKIQTAIDTVSNSYDAPVSMKENTSTDPALPASIQIRLAEKVPNAPSSTVDLFIDREQDQVLAIARSLDYSGLGITPAQIKNSLFDRYGEADAVVERPPGSKRDTVYLGWGQSPSTAAKLGGSRFLSDDCILYPIRNYRKRESRISTGELKTTCGSYLLAYITEHAATFLLIDTDVVMLRREAELEIRKLAEAEAKKSRAQGIKF